MTTVKEILGSKGNRVWSVSAESTVFEALELMAAKEIGAVPVLEGGKPIGILSERDYARKVILLGRDSRQTPVREIMTPDPVCIGPERTAQDCMAVMTESRVRHLPVMDDGQLVGLVSIGDLVKSIIADQKFTIEQLRHFITG